MTKVAENEQPIVRKQTTTAKYFHWCGIHTGQRIYSVVRYTPCSLLLKYCMARQKKREKHTKRRQNGKTKHRISTAEYENRQQPQHFFNLGFDGKTTKERERQSEREKERKRKKQNWWNNNLF